LPYKTHAFTVVQIYFIKVIFKSLYMFLDHLIALSLLLIFILIFRCSHQLTYPYSDRKHNVLSAAAFGWNATSVTQIFRSLFQCVSRTNVSSAAVTNCVLNIKTVSNYYLSTRSLHRLALYVKYGTCDLSSIIYTVQRYC